MSPHYFWKKKVLTGRIMIHYSWMNSGNKTAIEVESFRLDVSSQITYIILNYSDKCRVQLCNSCQHLQIHCKSELYNRLETPILRKKQLMKCPFALLTAAVKRGPYFWWKEPLLYFCGLITKARLYITTPGTHIEVEGKRHEKAHCNSHVQWIILP